MPLTKEQIEELKKKHGEVYELSGDDEQGELNFYFKKPDRPQIARFAKEVMTDALRAMNNLVFDCLISPSPDEVKKMFAEKPGLPIAIGGELQKIVGTNQSFLPRKL